MISEIYVFIDLEISYFLFSLPRGLIRFSVDFEILPCISFWLYSPELYRELQTLMFSGARQVSEVYEAGQCE